MSIEGTNSTNNSEQIIPTSQNVETETTNFALTPNKENTKGKEYYPSSNVSEENQEEEYEKHVSLIEVDIPHTKIDKDLSDKYFGSVFKDKKKLRNFKHGLGIYTFKFYDENKKVLTDVYKGEWNKDKKEGKGYYKYSNGNLSFGNFSNNEINGRSCFYWFNNEKNKYYQSFYGVKKYGENSKGILFYDKDIKANNLESNGNKNEIEKYIYLGDFNSEFKKCGKNGMLYDLKRNIFFFGQFDKDYIVNDGYQIVFENDKIIKTIFLKFNKDHEIEEIFFENSLRHKKEVDFIKNLAIFFYNKYIKNDIILRCFNDAYEAIKEVDNCPYLVEKYIHIIHETLTKFPKLLNVVQNDEDIVLNFSSSILSTSIIDTNSKEDDIFEEYKLFAQNEQ